MLTGTSRQHLAWRAPLPSLTNHQMTKRGQLPSVCRERKEPLCPCPPLGPPSLGCGVYDAPLSRLLFVHLSCTCHAVVVMSYLWVWCLIFSGPPRQPRRDGVLLILYPQCLAHSPTTRGRYSQCLWNEGRCAVMSALLSPVPPARSRPSFAMLFW